jgi:hypothetical protein
MKKTRIRGLLMEDLKLSELVSKFLGLLLAVAVFLVTSLFSILAESGLLKLLAADYTSIWMLLFYMVINTVLAILVNFVLRLINQQLFLSGRLSSTARRNVMIGIHWLTTFLLMEVTDLAMDSVKIPFATIVFTALLFNVVRSFVAAHRLQKLLENRED